MRLFFPMPVVARKMMTMQEVGPAKIESAWRAVTTSRSGAGEHIEGIALAAGERVNTCREFLLACMDAYIQQEMLTVALKNVLLGYTIVRDSKSANVYILCHLVEMN